MPTPHVRHVSVRVPWHDAEWNGHVCDDPLANSSCLALRLIAENRDDGIEQGIAKEAFDGLTPDQMPPCLRSSAAFLSPHSYTFQSVMEYSKWSRDHKHILPRAVHLPAFGALLIPYRWMLKDSGFEIAESLELDAHAEREPKKPAWLENTSWVQHQDNQRTLLDAFAKPLIKDETLIFFYAPRTPLCDDERRAILGVAFLETKSELVDYPYEGGKPGDRLQAMVWERPIQHSLRPRRKEGTGFSGGFVMPYHEILKLAERDPTVDPAEFVAFVPNDVRMQFSYGSEQVSHGVAAAVLAASRHALEKIGSKLEGPWANYISWIDERLGRLWRLQGPAPGLGVTVSALHKGFNGTLFAIALADVLGENEDPWPIVDAIFSGGQDAPAGAPKVTAALRKRWANVKTDPKRLASLKLLARFELTNDQAYRAVNDTEHGSLLSNPYVLYEDDRESLDSMSFATIDRGLYPGNEIADAHPLPAECERSLDEPDNPLRLRAACVHILEEAAAQGDTLLPADRVKDAGGELNLTRPLPLDAEMLNIFRQDFKPVVHVAGEKAKPTVQLERYVHYRELIEEAVKNRLRSKPKKVVVEWRASLDRKFGEARPDDVDELRARKEKEVALDRLAGSRIAALVGQAGTGKTTVLELLLQQHDVVGTRVHLLAPTGKARVRLAQETNRPGEGETIAQFLLALDRYDKVTGRYFPNPAAAKTEATTCIVDESSMMTEDMLAAIVDAIPDSCRLILVGDPYQLPPIGAGCPFVDIIEFLRRSHAEAIGELTVPRRQDSTSTDGRRTAPLERSDVQLAAIFSGRALLPGEDEIAARILTSADDEFVKCRRWDQTADLPNLLKAIFKEEFGAKDDSLQSKFEEFLGAVRNQKGYLNFENGCSDAASGWQILCVTKTQPGGSIHLNRHVKETYRGERLKKAIESNHVAHYRDWFRFIKPRGPEQITYGDKVICVRNHFRNPWLYTEKTRGSEDEYIANGEIEMVVGQCTYGKSNPRFTNAEFSGRSDRSFSFNAGAFREEGQPYLELAYAITVHKAQGSDFDTVVLALPAHSRLLSREMIYTALTRQKRRIWILHQGPFDTVLAYRHYSFSDIAARFTNLLREHRPQQVPNPVGLPSGFLPLSRGFLEERLVHRTIRGEMVSSKSELAIANILYSLEREGRLTYVVEPPLPFADNAKGRWADFQIRSQGETWFWEHCGMMDDQSYLRRWTRKEKLYEENGYTRHSEENPAGRLIVTEDGSGEGLDSQAIAVMARKLFVSVD